MLTILTGPSIARGSAENWQIATSTYLTFESISRLDGGFYVSYLAGVSQIKVEELSCSRKQSLDSCITEIIKNLLVFAWNIEQIFGSGLAYKLICILVLMCKYLSDTLKAILSS